MVKALRSWPTQIHGGFFILLSFALLIIPLQWLFGWLFSAAFHEMGHIIAIICNGHRINGVEIGWRGAKIHTDLLGNAEWVCAIAGPLFGFVLVLSVWCFPRLAICAFLQTVVNLMPIMPLDGGRTIKSLIAIFVNEDVAVRITNVIGVVALVVLVVCLAIFLASYM